MGQQFVLRHLVNVPNYRLQHNSLFENQTRIRDTSHLLTGNQQYTHYCRAVFALKKVKCLHKDLEFRHCTSLGPWSLQAATTTAPFEASRPEYAYNIHLLTA